MSSIVTHANTSIPGDLESERAVIGLHTPVVSIIMNCYNGEAYLREAIDSIYAQSFEDWEIIFWDNASTDNSANIANSYDKKLKYFRAESTTSLGAARNLALSKASGEFIGFLDTDDRWLPSKLEKQISLFQSNNQLGIVHSDVLCRDEMSGKSYGHFANLGHEPERGNIFQYLLMNNAIGMQSVVLRKKALLEQDTWFDERFEIYTDFDLFRRIAHDWQVDHVRDILAVYRIHEASSSTKFHSKAADELALTLEKFRKLYPEFDGLYQKETRYLEAMVCFQRGKSLWRSGQSANARREFRKFLTVPKVLLAYFSSYFPYSLAISVSRRLSKGSE